MGKGVPPPDEGDSYFLQAASKRVTKTNRRVFFIVVDFGGKDKELYESA